MLSAAEIYRRAIRKAKAQVEAEIKRVHDPEHNITKLFLRGKLIAVEHHDNLPNRTPGSSD